ncbi:MAG: cupin domain-containing protein, partial [Arachnia sp.]
ALCQVAVAVFRCPAAAPVRLRESDKREAMTVESTNLTDLINDQLTLAGQGETSGRSARTLHGGKENALRQTVVVMLGGHRMDEHVSPGEATLLVLAGSLRIHTAERQLDAREGDFVVIPRERHSVDALEDSALLLTVIKPVGHGYNA